MQNIKRNVVIDVDGIILDFSKGFARWWNSGPYCTRYNHTVPDNPRDWVFEWKDQNTIDIMYNAIDEFVDTNIHFSIIDKQFPQFLRNLRKKFRVIIVSAYPHAEPRIENLRQVDIILNREYDEIYCVDRKSPKTVQILKHDPVFVVEDCPNHVQELCEEDCIVFAPKKWNYLKSTFEKCDPKYLYGYDNTLDLESVIHQKF